MKEKAEEQTLQALARATALTFAAEAVVAAELGVVAAVMVAKSALPVAVALAAEAVVAPGLRCLPYSALPRVVLLDQCFAAVRPSLDSFR
jgi:hypothetical protein